MNRLLSNENQNANNTLMVFASENGCCPETEVAALKLCLYETVLTSFSTMTGFTITRESGDVAIVFASAITAFGDIKAAVIQALKDNGFGFDEDPLDVQVSESGGDVTVLIYGEAVIKEIAGAGGPFTPTVKCTKKGIADYSINYPGGTDPDLGQDGTITEVTGTFTNDAAGATALQTALATAVTGEQSVSVVFDGNLNTLVITIVHDTGVTFTWNSVTMPGENPRTIYIV